MADEHSPIRRSPEFVTTRWSMVHAAGQQSTVESREALTTLCQAYWYPLYAFARRRVSDAAEAQDLTQAFFAELLEKNYVGSATPERGRFRAYLLTALKHFLSKEWEKARAQKRGGGIAPLSLDFKDGDSRYGIQPAAGLTPEQMYDRQWALTLLDRTMQELADEYSTPQRSEQFRLLKGFIIGEESDTTYRDIAKQLDMTEGAAKMAAHRIRRRYRELLRREILQTVDSPDEVDDEIRNLFATLSQ
jgi:RNA polymerase sigma-70 factor (ECF subfamily)